MSTLKENPASPYDTILGFWRDQNGTTAIEYSLILALVFLAAITGFTVFGEQTNELFDTLRTTIGNAIT
ncbi:MAG: Flp family type IVb pilin [Pseudomonadota bacterium]